MRNNPRLLRITTVPISLKLLLKGQLSYFSRQGFDVLAVSADGPEIASILHEGVQHQIVDMTRKITPFRDLAALFQLIAVIRKFKPDIVHTHTPKAGLLGMLAAWLCRVPIRLHTVAGLPLMETQGFTRRLLTVTEKLTYACASGVYTNSAGLRQFIHRDLAIARRIDMIGKGSSNGIDTGFFSPTETLRTEASDIRQRHGILSEEVVFSFVGRIVKDKGVSELVRAFRLVRDSNKAKRFRLVLIGPFEQDIDPVTPEDYDFITHDDQVILAGFQADVRPWIMASDVFVFPSYREGFPNVVMQACCLQVPCVVSDINGCNEIIVNNQTGLIVPVKNAEKLAEAMQTLANDKEMRKSFAGSAQKYIAQNFEQRYVWSELQKEYLKLLGRKAHTDK